MMKHLVAAGILSLSLVAPALAETPQPTDKAAPVTKVETPAKHHTAIKTTKAKPDSKEAKTPKGESKPVKSTETKKKS